MQLADATKGFPNFGHSIIIDYITTHPTLVDFS